MRSTLALVSTLLGVTSAIPQAVTDVITPTAAAPAECTGTFDGNFEITIAEVTNAKRDLSQIEKRAECGSNGILVMSLEDGSVSDARGHIGYIASNFQFQFDLPPQAGAIFTSGFSICPGSLLALGDSTTFYRCLSGDFYNLYDRDWAEQCEPVSIVAVPCGSEDTASQIDDGQIVGTSVVETTIVTALSDGQPQVVTTSLPVPLCQIGDGQVQYQTTPCASVTAYPTTSYAPVSESSDGQIIATPPASAPSAPPTEVPVTPTSVSVLPTLPPISSVVSYPVPGNSTVSSSSAPTEESSSSSAPSATAPPSQETSAPPASGSTSVTAGSVGALVVGLMVAFVCL
jgi:hypothetical protein